MPDPAPAGAQASGSASTTGWFGTARLLFEDSRGMVEGWLRLAELETLLTAQSLVAMVCTGLGLALLLTSCWLGLLAALALELIASGTSAVLALLLVVLLNGLAAAVAYATFLRQARALGWPASLRAISGGEVAARPGVDPDRDDRNADH